MYLTESKRAVILQLIEAIGRARPRPSSSRERRGARRWLRRSLG